MKNCLFCNNIEISEENGDSGPPYVPVDQPDFICSSCKESLAKAKTLTPTVRKAYIAAIKQGYTRKPRAISICIMPERGTRNDTKTKKPERDMGRERVRQTSRPNRYRVRA